MLGTKCVWVGHNERIEIQPAIRGDFNGVTGRVDLVASDRRASLRFERINGEFSSGVKGKVSDQLTVSMTVGARQPMRLFGKNNCNLSGVMVTHTGEVNVVIVEKIILTPMPAELQPYPPDES